MIIVASFSQSDHDPALFIHTSPHGRTLLLLYVDDMLITGDDSEYIAFVKAHLGEQFLLDYKYIRPMRPMYGYLYSYPSRVSPNQLPSPPLLPLPLGTGASAILDVILDAAPVFHVLGLLMSICVMRANWADMFVFLFIVLLLMRPTFFILYITTYGHLLSSVFWLQVLSCGGR
jgi:hypothetical protein